MNLRSNIIFWFLLILLAMGGSSSAQTTAPGTSTERIPSSAGCAGSAVRWMVAKSALVHLATVMPVDKVRAAFDSPCTFLLGASNADVAYADWRAVKTKVIRSVGEADGCCEDGAIGAVLYDPETWKFTPAKEQQKPGDAACEIAKVVHAKGRTLIVSPAANLAAVQDPDGAKGRGRKYDSFLRLKIAGSVARCADVYEVQAQQAEGDLDAFRSFVHGAGKQARAANPKIVILVGLSTNPNGRQVSAEQLFKAVESVRGEVSGFWLNIPGVSEYCPNCGKPQPQVAAGFIQLVTQSH